MARRTPRAHRLTLAVEQLEGRALPALSPLLAPSPVPPEPLPPDGLCPQPNPGIYYDPGRETVCVVGSAGNDTVAVYRSGSNIVFTLDTGSLQFTFTAASDLVDHFNVDVRGGDDAIGVSHVVLQSAIILGGAGDDTVACGGGKTYVFGGAGDDLIRGGPGSNLLSGGEGNDWITGGRGSDAIYGGAGCNFLSGGLGNDLLVGGNGFDWMDGGAGDDCLIGGASVDVILCGAGNDTAYGGDGNDYIEGGAGQDYLEGGAGADFINACDHEQDTITYDLDDQLCIDAIDILIPG